MKNLLFAIRPLLMDFLSTAVFIAVSVISHNPLLATALAIGLGVAQVAFQMIKGRPVALMQWAGLGLVVVFGSATLISHDPRFMMVKPTLIYCAVGAVMLQPGWMLRYIPPVARELFPRELIVVWGYVWSGMMFLTGALNLGFALLTSLAVWSAFMAVFPLATKFGLFGVQYATMRRSAMRIRRARSESMIAEPSAAAA